MSTSKYSCVSNTLLFACHTHIVLAIFYNIIQHLKTQFYKWMKKIGIHYLIYNIALFKSDVYMFLNHNV